MIKNNNSNFIVVEASAGSGKTHNLAKRYITLLLDFDPQKKESVPLKNILALTFANKASIEMKERIIEYLKKISLNLDVGDLLNDITISKNQISENAVAAMKAVLENFDNFNVRTIDSFINLIIKSCALKLGFSPNYQILDSYADYIDYSIDAFLDNSLTNKTLKNILDDFFEQFIIDEHLSWNIKKYISDEFKSLYEKEISNNFLYSDKNKNYKKELSAISKMFEEHCLEMTKIKEFCGLNANVKKYIVQITEHKKSLFLSPVSAYFKKEDVPYNSKVSRSECLDELFLKSKKILQRFMEFKAHHYYDTYIKMFKYILAEFDSRSKLDSVVFLQDINRKVLKIFDENTLVPEIYCRLSSAFSDFLIDEFQDTNKIQWQTLKLIVEENLSQNGSFFYVGDKKQAIYGFRGSDFQIFDLPLTEFKMYSPQKITLDTNYRSYKAIVDFNNSVFCKDNIELFLDYVLQKENVCKADLYCKEIVDVFKNSQQKYCDGKQNGGYVEVSHVIYDKSDKEALDDKVKEYLYDVIRQLKERFDYKDIAIICRNNKEIEQVSKWLMEQNINIESYKTLNIINTDVVKELFSFLQFLNMPLDETSFAAFITSSVFLLSTGLAKQEVLDFIINNSCSENKEGKKQVLYAAFRDKYPDIWAEYIESFFNSAGFVAVYELSASIIAKYKVIENFKDCNNIILRFLEVISDFETKEQGLWNFIDYFKDFDKNKTNEKFFIKAASSDAIQIITVHKAKGLQFNVVIMPYLYLDISAAKNPFSVEKDGEMSFVKMTKDMTDYSSLLNGIYYKKYFKNLSDELNILYVAMTRAVCEFYGLISEQICHKQDGQNEKSPINMLIRDNIRKLGCKEKYVTEKKNSIDSIRLTATQIDDIVDVICGSSLDIYGRANKDMLLKGKIIHYGLSEIKTFNDSNIEEKIFTALKNVSVQYPNEDTQWLKEILNKLLFDSKIAAFFDEKNEVYNEKEFVDSFGNTIRLDKLIVKKDRVDIIDFKTSIYDKDAITKQMDKYLSVIKELYGSKEINCFVVDVENVKVLEKEQ